jgi:CelD/BcsL family acetyltransferase involved in cellulose biosynthesis
MLQTTHLPVHARARADEAVPTLSVAHASAAIGGLQLFVSHDLSAVEAEWRGFEQNADGTVFQCFDWLATWQKHVGSRAGATPAIVIARGGGGIACILPLAVSPWLGLRRLTFLGCGLCDYNAPLLAPDFTVRFGAHFPDVWRAIGALLQSDARWRHDVVLLDRMPGEVGTQPNPLLARAVSRHASSAYRMAMSGDWETFYGAKRSSATRRRDRTKRKRLAESGPVGMVTATSPAEGRRTLATLVAQKRRSLARMGAIDIFSRPGHLEFYSDIAGDPQAHPIAHVSRLEVGTQLAAANLGLEFRGTYYHVLASYDDGPLSKFGPGAIHMLELMQYALQRGCTAFDFTIGDEPYKRDWCDSETALYDHLAAASARGLAAVTMMRIALAGKRALKRSTLWPSLLQARAAIGAMRRPCPPGKAASQDADMA